MRAGLRELCLCLLLVVTAGCFTSRWGMDHSDYREKYDAPYPDEPLRKWGRMAKQMFDARHVAHDNGKYIGAAASNFRGNKAGGVEIGVTNYGSSWLSSKLAWPGSSIQEPRTLSSASTGR